MFAIAKHMQARTHKIYKIKFFISDFNETLLICAVCTALYEDPIFFSKFRLFLEILAFLLEFRHWKTHTLQRRTAITETHEN